MLLAWALHHSGKVHSKSRVAVVGGGFAGICVAATLALITGCHVDIFEKESVLLHDYQSAAWVDLSPNLNAGHVVGYDRALWTGRIRFFEFKSGSCSDLCRKWLDELKLLSEYLAIDIYFKTMIVIVSLSPDKIILTTLESEETLREEYDTAVFATGFGKEKGIFRAVNDYSYWQSGNPANYYPVHGKSSVIVIGGGDSGLAEVLYYLFDNFTMRDIIDILPWFYNDKSYSREYSRQLFDTSAIDIIYKGENHRNFPTWIRPYPHLLWFLGYMEFIRDNPSRDLFAWNTYESKSISKIEKKIFRKIERMIESAPCSATAQDFFDIIDEWRESSVITEVAKLRSMIDEIGPASKRAIMEDIQELYICEVRLIFGRNWLKGQARKDYFKQLRERMRPSVPRLTWIVKNGAYDLSLSRAYLPIVYFLENCAAVKLMKKSVVNVEKKASSFEVLFSDGTCELFDHVAARTGLEVGQLVQLVEGDARCVLTYLNKPVDWDRITQTVAANWIDKDDEFVGECVYRAIQERNLDGVGFSLAASSMVEALLASARGRVVPTPRRRNRRRPPG
jgi:hypothetical protein